MFNFTSPHFDIDSRTGFLPAQAPPRRLTGAHERWELLLDQARSHLITPGASPLVSKAQVAFSERWRRHIRKTPILSCVEIEKDVPNCRRAHHVLAFLVQFYVHSLPPRDAYGDPSSPIVIPAPIAVPLVAVSRCLGIAPIVTYADTVLWNWEKRDPDLPLSRENIRICDLFTSSPQEEYFFLTSARIEIRGWEALDAMEACVNESECYTPDLAAVAHNLRRLSGAIDDITSILLRVKDGLDPDFFYNHFRPWIQGADQGPESPSWFYEGVDGFGLTLQPSGPSAGQSALMHSFDLFLDIPHHHSMNGLGGGCTRFNAALNPHNRNIDVCLPPLHPPVLLSHIPPTPPTSPLIVPMTLDPQPTSLGQAEVDTSFNARMRSYMSQAHQDFLTQLERHSIRSFVHNHATESRDLTEAYNSCVAALKGWRDAHIRIVTQFVIIPARATVHPNRTCADERSEPIGRTPVRGTGGTSLVPLLKVYRDNTLRRLIFPWA